MSSTGSAGLFRAETLEARQEASIGTVSVSTPPGLRRVMRLLFAGSVAFMVAVVTVPYSRKVSVVGEIVTVPATVKIVASAAGEIAHILVNDGQTVAAGQPLVEFVADRQDSGGAALSARLEGEIARRLESSARERQDNDHQVAARVSMLKEKLHAALADVTRIDGQIQLHERKRQMSAEALEQAKGLAAANFLSPAGVRDKQVSLIEEESVIGELRRTRDAKKSEGAQA